LEMVRTVSNEPGQQKLGRPATETAPRVLSTGDPVTRHQKHLLRRQSGTPCCASRSNDVLYFVLCTAQRRRAPTLCCTSYSVQHNREELQRCAVLHTLYSTTEKSSNVVLYFLLCAILHCWETLVLMALPMLCRHENQNAAKVARAAVRAARKAREAHKDRLGRKQKELEQTQRSLDEAIEQAAEASQVRVLFLLKILDQPFFERQGTVCMYNTLQGGSGY
jgi:hypothetical protein